MQLVRYNARTIKRSESKFWTISSRAFRRIDINMVTFKRIYDIVGMRSLA